MISLADFVNLNPVPMMAGIVRVITNSSIFLPRLKFITCNDFGYRYNQETALGGIAFRNLNGSYASATDTQSVINPLIETLSIFGGTVKTDRQLVNLRGDAVRSAKISAKVRRAALFFDKNVIQGDPGAVTGSFYGLNSRLAGKQLILAGTNGAALTVDMAVAMQDAVVGTNEQKKIVCNKGFRRALSTAIRGDAKGLQFVEASGGQVGPDGANIPGRNATFNQSEIIVLDEDGDDQPILTNTESVGTSGAVCCSAYCINMGQDEEEQNMQGLVGARLIETVQYGERDGIYSDLIEGLMGLAVFHPRAAARLHGVIINLPTYGS